MKSLQKEQIAQIYYYDPQSAGINVQSPQSESTPRRLTLKNPNDFFSDPIFTFTPLILNISMDHQFAGRGPKFTFLRTIFNH